MIDPRTVLFAIPCYQGKVEAELMGMLVSFGRVAFITVPTECSSVSLVRNLIAAQFMESGCEWLVGIDADIVPTSRRDFEYLLEPCDLQAKYLEQYEEQGASSAAGEITAPRPSRIITSLVVDPKPGEPADLSLRYQGAADRLVVSEYAYKRDNFEPVKLGMGFVRIHRSVFEQLQELKHEAGPTIEVRRDLIDQLARAVNEHLSIGTQPGDPNHGRIPTLSIKETLKQLQKTAIDHAGTPRLWYGTKDGRTYWHYFPEGPLLSQYVPTAEWKGEDHGFFTLCMLAGLTPRIETRTRLLHMGRKAYPYLGPNAGGGQ